MCSDASLVQAPNSLQREKYVAAMVLFLVPRGPDDKGVAHDHFFSLEQSWLAIMDPANGRKTCTSDLIPPNWYGAQG